jgi:hypothetical protein
MKLGWPMGCDTCIRPPEESQGPKRSNCSKSCGEGVKGRHLHPAASHQAAEEDGSQEHETDTCFFSNSIDDGGCQEGIDGGRWWEVSGGMRLSVK